MSDKPQRQPAIFLPHGGGPCFFMDWTWGPADTWNATQRFLEGLAATLPESPKAILVVSGHWEEAAFTASASRVIVADGCEQQLHDVADNLLRLPHAGVQHDDESTSSGH